MKAKVEFYDVHANVIGKTEADWRWHVADTNGKILAASSEGYKKRADAVRNFRRLSNILYYANYTISHYTGKRGNIEFEVNA